MDERELISQSPYILFYARRDIRALQKSDALGLPLGPRRNGGSSGSSGGGIGAVSPLADDELDAFAAQRDGGRCQLQ